MDDGGVHVSIRLVDVPHFMITVPQVAVIRVELEGERVFGYTFRASHDPSLRARPQCCVPIRFRLSVRYVAIVLLHRFVNDGMEVVVPHVIMINLAYAFEIQAVVVLNRLLSVCVVSRPWRGNVRVVFQSVSVA